MEGSVFVDKPHSLPWLPVAQMLDDYDEPSRAVKLYQLAAQAGNAEAMTRLGLAYLSGRGIKRTYSMAARWLRLAAIQHHAEAEYHLAQCHINGRGVPRNYQQAIQLLTASATAGYKPAMIALAECLEQGEIVTANEQQAQQWRQRATQAYTVARPDEAHPAPDNTARQQQ